MRYFQLKNTTIIRHEENDLSDDYLDALLVNHDEISEDEYYDLLSNSQKNYSLERDKYEKSEEYQKMLREQQKTQKAQLLSEVKEEIEILNDAIDFDEAEEGDEDYLVVLKKYRVQLNKVDTDIVPCEFPIKPQK